LLWNFFFRQKKKSSGRNSQNKIILRTKIQKKKKFLHIKTFWIKLLAIIIKIKKNNFSNFFLLKYSNFSLCFIKSIQGLFLGTFLKIFFFFCKFFYQFFLGFQTFFFFLQKKYIVSNIKNYQKQRGNFLLANGTYAKIFKFQQEKFFSLLIFPSTKKIVFNLFSLLIIGRNSNLLYKFQFYAKAGENFKKGKKFLVRGVAQNAVDHPHGGKTKTNKPEVSIWGWVTKFSH